MDIALVAFSVAVVVSVGSAVVAVSAARRAASFDITRDFDALCTVVGKLQKMDRSERMSKVRAAALEPTPQALPASTQPLTHEQLRARARANGVLQ